MLLDTVGGVGHLRTPFRRSAKSKAVLIVLVSSRQRHSFDRDWAASRAGDAFPQDFAALAGKFTADGIPIAVRRRLGEAGVRFSLDLYKSVVCAFCEGGDVSRCSFGRSALWLADPVDRSRT